MILPLVKYPDRRLKQAAQNVVSFGPELRELVANMFETCTAHGGIGLAANQVGDGHNVLVIDVTHVTRTSKWTDPEKSIEWRGPLQLPAPHTRFALVNAIVLPDDTSPWVKAREGCLSCPGTTARVPRRDVVHVNACDEHGNPRVFTCSGWLARVIQHEADHLAGYTLLNPR